MGDGLVCEQCHTHLWWGQAGTCPVCGGDPRAAPPERADPPLPAAARWDRDLAAAQLVVGATLLLVGLVLGLGDLVQGMALLVLGGTCLVSARRSWRRVGEHSRGVPL